MWDLLLILPLGSMMCSDFRMRRITLADLLLFGILQWGMSYYEWGCCAFFVRIFVNLSLLCFIGIIVAGYYYLRYGKKSLRKQIGVGDLWFCLLLLPAFSCWELTFFLPFSGLIMLSVWWVYVRIKRREVTIPLVGGLGCMYMLLILMRVLGYG